MNWVHISKLTADLHDVASGSSAAADANPIPVHWVLATLLDLFREYPNGVTDAIARTELLVRWKLHRQRSSSNQSNKTAGWASSSDTAVVRAQITEFIADQHILILREAPATSSDIPQNDPPSAFTKNQNMHLFVHQRFHRYLPSSSAGVMHPFNPSRRLLLTALQLFERRQPRDYMQCLPTENMIVVLDPSCDPWDRSLMAGTSCVSTLSALHRIPADQLHVQLLRMKVVAVEPTRSCVASVNASRRLSIVVAGTDKEDGDNSSSRSDDSHTFLFVLWDTQTPLGLSVHPGDTLIMDCPYLNIRDSANMEHQAMFEECPGCAATHLFLEYGSSTILFVVPAESVLTDVVTQPNKVAFTAPVDPVTKFSDLSEYPLPLDEWKDLPVNCYNLSFLGQVADIHVARASPLRQQFTATYFGSKGMMMSADDDDASRTSPQPAFTVVLTLRSLQPPFPLLSIEVTGRDQVACALATCEPGHLVFVQNVVLVKTGHTTMGLCANWSSLHPAFANGKLTAWNRLLGYVTSPDFYDVQLVAHLHNRVLLRGMMWPQLAVVRASFVASGWLDPSPTTLIHRACRRPIAPKHHPDDPWACDVCKVSWNQGQSHVEIGFSRLAVQVDDGSASIRAVMSSRWLENLLGCTALSFDQLPLTEQASLVACKCSTGHVYVCVLSSCPSVDNIVWRIDQAIPLTNQVTNQILQLHNSSNN